MIAYLGLFYAFLFGATFGSFLNVCISRWPQGLSIVKPRSRCPQCSRAIKASENIPILSWFLLRAKCRGCSGRISALYPAIELATALLWTWAFWKFGATFTAFRVAVVATVLLGVAVTDAREYVIPDGFTLFGLLFALVTAFAGAFMNDQGPFASPWQAIIGLCAGAGAIAVVGWLGEVFLRKPAMGFGDVTLMAVLGAVLGPERSLMTIFIAALLAIVALIGIIYPLGRMRSTRSAQYDMELDGAGSWRGREIPFGVFLAPAGMIALVHGQALIAWYMRISGL